MTTLPPVEAPAVDLNDLRAYSYELPPELIAQHPAPRREDARLLSLAAGLHHLTVRDLPLLLTPDDILVVNDSRVIPARLWGVKQAGGGRVELLLVHPETHASGAAEVRWHVMVRASRPRAGMTIAVGADATATIETLFDDGTAVARLRTPGGADGFFAWLDGAGEVPLPPYIERAAGEGARAPDDKERYQTVYADRPGSVAAPTAGLHLTREILDRLAAQGTGVARLTLHVGLGTFQPLRTTDLSQARLHAEWLSVSPETVAAIEACRARGGRVVAVGTTSCRALETAARGGTLAPYAGWTDLMIGPGYDFRVVDAMLTNFHLPESSLLVLVTAFGGFERVLGAYRAAVAARYRFFSYGDAMFVTRARR